MRKAVKLLEPCIKIIIPTEIRSKFKVHLVHQELYIRYLDIWDYIKMGAEICFNEDDNITIEMRHLNDCYKTKYRYERRLR